MMLQAGIFLDLIQKMLFQDNPLSPEISDFHLYLLSSLHSLYWILILTFRWKALDHIFYQERSLEFHLQELFQTRQIMIHIRIPQGLENIFPVLKLIKLIVRH